LALGLHKIGPLDDDAADRDWFPDGAPAGDSWLATQVNHGEQNRMDQLTVFDHEMGPRWIRKPVPVQS
jgi:hypothetical protein